VLVSYDDRGRVLDFGAIEVQAVYISGNVRQPFETYMNNPEGWDSVDWSKLAAYYPTPDYLSSSRKRLVPQLLYKGTILQEWGKKQPIAVQKRFFETLPQLPQVQQQDAEIAWKLYDLEPQGEKFNLALTKTIYTEYWAALNRISTPQVGKLEDFMDVLQRKLDSKLDSSPDTQTTTDLPLL
jgi:hypothetical protein